MSVIHIFKDGSRTNDIKGHVIKIGDAELLYRFIHSINQKSNVGKKNSIHTISDVTRSELKMI
jgi:hypothetical protein